MATYRTQVDVATQSRVEVRNVSREVSGALSRSPVKDGIACLTVRHTTCALALNEDERGLLRDLRRLATTLLDPLRESTPFEHDEIDHNAQAHLTSVVLGPSLTLPVAGGSLVLGTWQSILLVEMDGPRRRTVDVMVVG